MSSKIEDWMRRYVHYHKKGNPQLMLQVFLPKKAVPQVLCLWLDGSTENEVHCRKLQMWIDAKTCYNCKFNRLRKKVKK